MHELELATRLAPDDLRPWNYLGFAYARRGERARAAAAFRRAGSEAMAAEVESEAIEQRPELYPMAAPTRVDGEGSGPRGVAGGSGRAVISPGALPSTTFEPAFDLCKLPLDARASDERETREAIAEVRPKPSKPTGAGRRRAVAHAAGRIRRGPG